MVELIPEVDLIPLMELIPVVEPIPVIDMIPKIMIPIPTYPHCSMGDSNSDSKKNWNHNTSTTDGGAESADGSGNEQRRPWRLISSGVLSC